MKVVGCYRSSGEFTNQNGEVIKYDNYVFIQEYPSEKSLFGNRFIETKVKVADYEHKYGQDVKSLQGKEIEFAFDTTGKHFLGVFGK